MIKIFFSGTYNGFSPQYFTDGENSEFASNMKLSDPIASELLILDRRQLFTTAEGNISGYGFQLVNHQGILFHKAILMLDKFYRGGFMMASIFVPVSQKLDGRDIMEALDSLIIDYKSRTVNGMVSVEIDWSFANRKAKELNAKAKPESWERRKPVGYDVNKVALVAGVSDRVADYFRYPNPLNEGLKGYGLVFLSETLLDPTMSSDGSGQGYTIISKEAVDIDNPVYAFVYTNTQGCSTGDLKQSVRLKDLTANADSYYLGTITKRGYKQKPVYLSPGQKVSKDGETIEVELPTLVQKKATILLTVKDAKTGAGISLDECTVKWKDFYDSAPELRTGVGRSFRFEGEECEEKKWTVRVEYKGDKYDPAEKEVVISDLGENQQEVKIELKPVPMWTIVLKTPLGSNSYKDITINKLEEKIREIKKYAVGPDLVLEPDKRDNTNRIVTLEAKKKEEPKPIDTTPASSSNNEKKENRFKTPATSTADSASTPAEPEKKNYVLQLDEKSKKYDLFKNYPDRCEKEKKAREAIEDLASMLEVLEQQAVRDGKKSDSNKVYTNVKAIHEALTNSPTRVKVQSTKRKQLKNLLDYLRNDEFRDVVKTAEKAVNLSLEYLKIDNVLKADLVKNGYSYNHGIHSLERQAEKKPAGGKKIVLNETKKYKYWIEKTTWTEANNVEEGCKNIVKRKPTAKYILRWVFAILAVAVAAFAVYFFIFRDQEDPLSQQKQQMTEYLPRLQQTRYVGDAFLDTCTVLIEDYNNVADMNHIEQAKEDTTYKAFLKAYAEQNNAKKADADQYMNAVKLLNIGRPWIDLEKRNWENIVQWKDTIWYNDYMSEEHLKELNDLYRKKMDDEKAAERKAEEEYWQYNVNGPNSCRDYVRRFGENAIHYNEAITFIQCSAKPESIEEYKRYLDAYPQRTGNAKLINYSQKGTSKNR